MGAKIAPQKDPSAYYMCMAYLLPITVTIVLTHGFVEIKRYQDRNLPFQENTQGSIYTMNSKKASTNNNAVTDFFQFLI